MGAVVSSDSNGLAEIPCHYHMAVAGMTSRVIAIISPNRLGIDLIAFAFLCGSGCEKPARWEKKDIDRQACLGSRLAPIEPLAACSRFIIPVGDRKLTRSDACYH
jgi:hypothetical protein